MKSKRREEDGAVGGRFVAYYRISTEKQDIECAAQKQAVMAWLNGGNHELIDEFIEVETGKRMELQKAIALCRKRKACEFRRSRTPIPI
jgi:DNA invertase Pin-like site-specific DNA recombinase